MTTLTAEQAKRREELLKLTDIFHRGKMGDYEDNYVEFAATYGLPRNEADICEVCGEEKEAKVHTDTELHPDDAADGLTLHPFTPREGEPIPRYASVAEDETYGMVHLVDSLSEAIAGQAGIPGSGEYLNVPAGVYDLDTGERVPYRLVALSEEAYAVLCGLVQPNWLLPLVSPMNAERPGAPTEAVNHAGIYTGAWDELRASFPLEHFRRVAQERGEDFYNEEAGL